MAGSSTLDPDNTPRRKRRKTLKGHSTREFGPSDSSDTGSDVVGPPPAGDRLGDRGGQDRDADRVVAGREAGLGRGLDEAEEARLRDEIAKAAYYRAEKRGFTPGYEERDWVEAEAEVRARRAKRPQRKG